MASSIQIQGAQSPATDWLLHSDAKNFLLHLHHKFQQTRLNLLSNRAKRQERFARGELPRFLEETQSIRTSEWKVTPPPHTLEDRRVEITGPVDRKMMINALNSGARVFMADFEDSLSPTWSNIVQGQVNVFDAYRKSLRLETPGGKTYELNEKVATLLLRPRGWHMEENHFLVDGKPISASLFDFGLAFFHNAKETTRNHAGPYFYLPKMESHLEARLWNDVFCESEDYLNLPLSTIRATVLIETLPAAFEMEEILYELRHHILGLNAGRWDYIFSTIKCLRDSPDFVLPDRSQVTMQVPFMKAYAQLLVKTCHKRGAHAMGGMSAFVPNRKDPEVTKQAFAKVREDKEREAREGFDGTWVAHPDLVSVAQEAFDHVLGSRPNQKEKLREDVSTRPENLLNLKIDGASITEKGIRDNIEVSLLYLNYWLEGQGASAIHNLMEDVATAEISRAQLWQWIKHRVTLSEGRQFDSKLCAEFIQEEQTKLAPQNLGHLSQATQILRDLVVNSQWIDFLTRPAYAVLTQGEKEHERVRTSPSPSKSMEV